MKRNVKKVVKQGVNDNVRRRARIVTLLFTRQFTKFFTGYFTLSAVQDSAPTLVPAVKNDADYAEFADKSRKCVAVQFRGVSSFRPFRVIKWAR